jgi:hypothetical protein
MSKKKIARSKDAASAALKSNSLAVPDPWRYHSLGLMQCALTAPHQYLRDDESKRQATDGSVELYSALQPNDPLQSMLASLIVGISNTTSDCLSQAARLSPDALQHRDLNLKYALKGAGVVTRLIEAFERLRGSRPSNVSVGNVNVQSGGQAIVDTVHSGNPDPDPRTPVDDDAEETGKKKG